MQTSESNRNNIEATAGYIESSSDIKHNEPTYEMFDAAHNKSTIDGGVHVQPQWNMQRILVNVSIGTDMGDGTKNHGVYMLHVSVPAGPNLMPYLDGDNRYCWTVNEKIYINILAKTKHFDEKSKKFDKKSNFYYYRHYLIAFDALIIFVGSMLQYFI